MRLLIASFVKIAKKEISDPLYRLFHIIKEETMFL